ncbi:MAG: Hpt domain-containing protein [Atopobiaceae bacterium]|nr:Hpt domain-containing protein [Atopobiaceae bacterium]
MTTKELYDRIGGDYAAALGRMQMDAFVARIIVKFADDTSCNDLFAAWDAGNERAAFEAAHRAKGVCANLGITSLATRASEICEALREGNDELRATTDVDALVAELKARYAEVIAAIAEFAG